MRKWFNKALYFLGFVRDEKGTVNIGNILMLGIGMIFIAIGFVIFPVVMQGTGEILRYDQNNVNVDNFTGLESTAKIGPLITFVGFLSAGVITGFFGIKNMVR